MAKPHEWDAEIIKARLRIRYGSLTALAESWGYHRSAISAALHRPLSSTVIETRIAQALGQHPHTLWPERRSADGQPLHRRWHFSARAKTEHRQIEKVA